MKKWIKKEEKKIWKKTEDMSEKMKKNRFKNTKMKVG